MSPTEIERPQLSRAAHTAASTVLAMLALTTSAATSASAQHDCIPYMPTEAGGSITSNWSVPNEQDDYPGAITIPSDPGGGYVIATITSQAPSEPLMRIIPPSGQGTVTQQGTDTLGPSPHTLTVAFEVDASTSFDVEIVEDVNAPIQDHPVSYTWSWTFFSQVDCYEPNDGRPSSWPAPTFDAREIPFDQELSAYSIAGHLSFAIPSNSAHNYDWYEFTLDAPTNLWFAVTKVPDDQRFRMRLWSTDGSAQFEGLSGERGDEISFGPELVGAGTWYLEIHPFDNGEEEATLSEGEAIPDHFVTPYRFVVSTQPISGCGFMAIFCDGFETGDTTIWSATSP